MLGYQLFCGILLATLCSLSTAAPNRPLTASDRDDAIFIRGKWFNRNGKSNLPLQQTSPLIFQQCMDHFTASGCDSKWEQQYWVRKDYYRPGGPIFFQFGGEAPASGMVDVYYWHQYASFHGAMLIVLEHRFYGDSWPTFDSSFQMLSKLLTSEQALADAAYFIDVYNEDNNLGEANWVAFGGSYAGNLAAWMKAKYPSHVKTAVSSSGPLEAQLDFPGYLETVSEVVKQIDPVCYSRVFSAFECMESLVNGTGCFGYTNPSQIPLALQQCYSVNFGNQLDREIFFNNLAMGMWADNLPGDLVKSNCRSLTDGSNTNALEDYGNFLVSQGQGGNCQESTSTLTSKRDEVLEFINTKEGRQSGAAGWFWQSCYEFGYFMSADPINGLFGYETFSALPSVLDCIRQYGSRFTIEYIESRIAATNDLYLGKNLDANCVILINGEWDPWHTLGINNASETSSRNTVVFVPKGEHCDDMNYPLTEDMRQAQAKIQEQIGIYLNDPTC